MNPVFFPLQIGKFLEFFFFCVLDAMKVFLARNRSKVRVLRVAEHTYFIIPALEGLEALVSSGTPVKSDDASMLSNDLEYSSTVWCRKS